MHRTLFKGTELTKVDAIVFTRECEYLQNTQTFVPITRKNWRKRGVCPFFRIPFLKRYQHGAIECITARKKIVLHMYTELGDSIMDV